MRIEFHGAAGEVTGSGHLLVTERARVLLDWGLFQGGRQAERGNRRPPAFDVRALDAVVLSHAHIDHCGRLPLLAQRGLRAPIWCTPATRDLCGIMLPDAAHVMEHDSGRRTRHRSRRGRRPAQGRPVRPLYDQDDVAAALQLMRALPCGRARTIAPGVELRFHDAGHILGSAICELEVEERGRHVRLVFSGDLGNAPVPLMREPARLARADVLLLESTYGDREHRSLAASLDEFRGILLDALQRGGKVLVPAFAVGRTQLLIYQLGELFRDGLLDGLPVFVDSPMAVSVTDLYRRHREEFDDEAWRLIESGQAPLDFPSLRLTRSVDESRALNERRGPAVIISASGMCTGGRILHHLAHHAGRPDTHVVITGFQAAGTPGRALVDGARSLRLMGGELAVRAQVHTIGGFSAHADRRQLVDWVEPLRDSHPQVFLVHGEDRARQGLAAALAERHTLRALLPRGGQAFEL